jgi:hypothetical protein
VQAFPDRVLFVSTARHKREIPRAIVRLVSVFVVDLESGRRDHQERFGDELVNVYGLSATVFPEIDSQVAFPCWMRLA